MAQTSDGTQAGLGPKFAKSELKDTLVHWTQDKQDGTSFYIQVLVENLDDVFALQQL